MKKDLIFSIIGLGKLGTSMAAAIASRNLNVIGVDVNHRNVDLLNAGHTPVRETNLEETITANKERLRATLNHREAVLNSDVSFVIVPTPNSKNGAFSLHYAGRAFKEIGSAISEKSTYHLVVLTSTVLPGSTRYGLLPILEKYSEKKCGTDFGLCYSPEFIALGRDYAELETVWSAFGVYREEKDVGSAGGYLVDHTARVYVIDLQGNLRLTFSFGMASEAMTKDVMQLLKGAGL